MNKLDENLNKPVEDTLSAVQSAVNLLRACACPGPSLALTVVEPLACSCCTNGLGQEGHVVTVPDPQVAGCLQGTAVWTQGLTMYGTREAYGLMPSMKVSQTLGSPSAYAMSP